MYCRKCGARIAEGTSFCTSCGERIAPLAVTIEEQRLQAEQPAPVPQPTAVPEMSEPTQTVETNAVNETTEPPKPNEPVNIPVQNEIEPQKIPAYTAPTAQQAQSTILPPVIAVEKTEKVKTDFGKGALAFCLVIIGLLAISTGVFAGLYFSLL